MKKKKLIANKNKSGSIFSLIHTRHKRTNNLKVEVVEKLKPKLCACLLRISFRGSIESVSCVTVAIFCLVYVVAFIEAYTRRSSKSISFISSNDENKIYWYRIFDAFELNCEQFQNVYIRHEYLMLLIIPWYYFFLLFFSFFIFSVYIYYYIIERGERNDNKEEESEQPQLKCHRNKISYRIACAFTRRTHNNFTTTFFFSFSHNTNGKSLIFSLSRFMLSEAERYIEIEKCASLQGNTI